MRKLQRHRRSLIWIASLSAAVTVATAGATSVMAEGPACIVDGQPVTQEQLALDASLCPTETAPEPQSTTEPTPEPEPAPEPEADPTQEPDASPEPEQPQPQTPQPGSPEPIEPAPPTPTTDQTTTTDEATPTKRPPGTVAPKPTTPVKATPKDPSVERTHEQVRAKQFDVPFRDARTYREQYQPTGRIPRQPRMNASEAGILLDAAAGVRTSWSTLAAVAWLESRWNDPTAGGIVGRRLTAQDWARFGSDGDGDGTVDRASRADQARTVAVFLSRVHADEHEALRAYFNYAHRDVMAERAELLAAYFDALGPYVLVHGIEDA
jgi:hypothetical protein